MKRELLLSLCAGILGLQMASAAEGEIPQFNIATACQGSGSVQTPAECAQNEEAARSQLKPLWAQFKQADVTRCVQSVTDRAGAASYVELLTCLQAGAIESKKPTDPFGQLPTIAK